MSSATDTSARLAVGFSQLGHAVTHVMLLLYPTVVIALEREMGMTYGELIVLMTLGNVLVGVGALPAGWLGDRWSARAMMVLLFFGMGAGAIATGLASTPLGLTVGLAVLGLFASIYHPVGMAWVVRNARNRGRALGVNGVFGTLGVAAAGVVAGWLTELWSWRVAFIAPGVVCVVLGAVLLGLVLTGRIVDRAADARPQPPASRDAMIRAFVVLSVTMLCTGILHQAFPVVMPKAFSERLADLVGSGAGAAGTLVALVYLLGIGAQLLGGHLADRYDLRLAYLGVYLLQVPLLLVAAGATGIPFFLLLTPAVLLSTVSVAVENSLLSRYSPDKWRGTAFGAKFVLSAGVSAASIPLVALVHESTGDFFWVLVLLAGCSFVVVIASLWLPREPRRVAQAAG